MEIREFKNDHVLFICITKLFYRFESIKNVWLKILQILRIPIIFFLFLLTFFEERQYGPAS